MKTICTLFFCVATLVAVSSFANARLGESYEQTIARYGEPTWGDTEKTWANFAVGTFRLGVEYRADTAVSITYTSDKLLGRLSREQVDAILSTQSLPEGSVWQEIKNTEIDFSTHWLRGDEQAKATWRAGTRDLHLILVAEIALRKIEREEAKRAAEHARQKAAQEAARGL